jgi:hypothetical protein
VSVSECDILDLALWAAKGPVQTGSLGVMGLAVFGTAFVDHYNDLTLILDSKSVFILKDFTIHRCLPPL